MAAQQKLTVWLGDPDEDDTGDYFIHTEDSSVMIECIGRESGIDYDILIAPCLFPQIRAAMDSVEKNL